MKHPLNLKFKFLVGFGTGFLLSMFLAMILNNSFGWLLMGIMMVLFFFQTFFILFKDVISLPQFYSILEEKAGDKKLSWKFWGYTGTGALVGVGFIMIIIMLVVWFVAVV